MIAFTSLCAAVKEALMAEPPVAPIVMRGRLRPVAEGENEMVVVRLERAGGEQAQISGGPTDWSTSIAVDVYARAATDSDEAEDLAGELLGRVYERLAGLDLSAYGVTGFGLNPEVAAGSDAVDSSLAAMTLFLNIQHCTGADNLNPRT